MPIVRLFGTEESVLLEFEVLQTQVSADLLRPFLLVPALNLSLFAKEFFNVEIGTKAYLVIIKRDIMFAHIRRSFFSYLPLSWVWVSFPSESLAERTVNMADIVKQPLLKKGNDAQNTCFFALFFEAMLHSSSSAKFFTKDSGLNRALPEGPQSNLQRWKGWPTDWYILQVYNKFVCVCICWGKNKAHHGLYWRGGGNPEKRLETWDFPKNPSNEKRPPRGRPRRQPKTKRLRRGRHNETLKGFDPRPCCRSWLCWRWGPCTV